MRASILRWQALVHGLTAAQKANPDTLSALLLVGYAVDRIEYWQRKEDDVLKQSLQACFMEQGHAAPQTKPYPEAEPVLEPTTLIGVMTALTHQVNELAQCQQELHIKLKELCQVLGLPCERE